VEKNPKDNAAPEDRGTQHARRASSSASTEHNLDIYTFGRSGGGIAGISCQGDIRTTTAAIAATQRDGTFRTVRSGLLVGISEGRQNRKDVRLRDRCSPPER
jgi:hypothetical protein